MKIFAAPLQGYTEAPFRHFHAGVYGTCGGAADAYYIPFLRVEHGEPRSRDLRDALSPLNDNHTVVPQIIARDAAEFSMLTDLLVSGGHTTIDLNMGCPFTPQVRKGRGAGLIPRREQLLNIADLMHGKAERGTKFTIKMRLGIDRPDEWIENIDVINSMPLTHVTVHPRVARQQYGGTLHLDEFTALLDRLRHPVVFNGELHNPADIESVSLRFPTLVAVMTGRGLLARPSLIAEWRKGREWDRDKRIRHLLALHDGVRQHYETTLCGETQILSKLKPFWDYLEEEIGHKTTKAIRKATTLPHYNQAITSIH